MLLRPYQNRSVSRAIDALKEKGNTLSIAATGAGKTIILSDICRQINGRQLILQHREELIKQIE